MPCLTEGRGLSHRKQRCAVGEEAAEALRSGVRFGLHSKSGGAPRDFCSLTSHVCSLAHSAPGQCTLTSGLLCLLSLLPEILPTPPPLPVSCSQPSFRMPLKPLLQRQPTTPTLAPELVTPWPGFIFLQGPNPSLTLYICYLPPRLEPRLLESQAWSGDHSCVLSARCCAWLIVESFEWASGRSPENVYVELPTLLANFAPPSGQ